jgi:hypothetical protein
MKLRTVYLALNAFSIALGTPVRRDDGSNNPLRGSKSLLGYSTTNDDPTETKPDIKYSLVPGQNEDPAIGSYLDFENADNPQPSRGDRGGDDPGPSMYDG